MAAWKENISLWRAIARNPQILKAGPGVNRFFLSYLRKFRVTRAGENLIIHSHLPPVNSAAYKRFINEHLLGRTDGPSHAQVGLTDACPQNCAYCYNRGRDGRVMDSATIIRVIQELKELGVFWVGFTGGEPLLNQDIVAITEKAADGCAVKLFTTGSTLTPLLAADLRRAGLFSVCVSLDDWREEEHDKARRTRGAFRQALRAIEIFQGTDGLHVGVSAVLSRSAIARDEVEELLHFLTGLGVQEAWLSEAKPSIPAYWDPGEVITEADRKKLVSLQDRYNREGRITVNYLAHFEGKEHFGCNAGHKMIYVDAYGEVSPCVFIPMTFGNAQDKPVREIFASMHRFFPSEESCFINRNYPLLRKHGSGRIPLSPMESQALLGEVKFGPLAKFFQIHYGRRRP
jgi:MoaA/NifB/PqqE/SkfB family radical SAM enzyme